MENNVKKNIEKIKNFNANLARENQQTEHKSAEIIQFRQKITQFELTKAIYESKLFSEVKLTATSKLFLWALCTHFNPNNEDMFPAQTTVAKKLGISAKSAERAVKELVAQGLITYTTKRVNHYKFGENFFRLVKMSVVNRQNVGREDRQNVGLTNKEEQEKNIKNFSSFKKEVSKKSEKRTKSGLWTPNENSGSKCVQSVEETKNYFENLEAAAKKSINPWNFTKKEAIKWLRTVTAPALLKSNLAIFLIKKYKLEEFYPKVFNAAELRIIKEIGLEKFDKLEPSELETLTAKAYSEIREEQLEKLNNCTLF